jgi:opacity protein-like surface antigen
MAAEESLMIDTKRRTFAVRKLAGVLALALLATTCAGVAQAVELIPSLGITKSTDTNAGDAKGFGGLALRTSLLSFLKLEGGVGYRQDSFAGGDIKVRQWPATASLWVSPFPILYGGAGVGWYRTTTDYRASLQIKDTTTKKMGVHLGGGMNVPIAPHLGLDLSGRYIFMKKDKASPLVPTTFNPDFWTTSLGLAIKF